MPERRSLREVLELLDRRARHTTFQELAERLRLSEVRTSPRQWLAMTLAKLAVVFVLATLAATAFTGGILVMRSLGIGH